MATKIRIYILNMKLFINKKLKKYGCIRYY